MLLWPLSYLLLDYSLCARISRDYHPLTLWDWIWLSKILCVCVCLQASVFIEVDIFYPSFVDRKSTGSTPTPPRSSCFFSSMGASRVRLAYPHADWQLYPDCLQPLHATTSSVALASTTSQWLSPIHHCDYRHASFLKCLFCNRIRIKH